MIKYTFFLDIFNETSNRSHLFDNFRLNFHIYILNFPKKRKYGS